MGAHGFGEARDDAARVLDSLRRLVRFLRVAASRAERRTGVSAARLFVLEQLAAAPALSQVELAERTLTDPSSVSTVVARLVESGLVARRVDAGDRRRVELALTPKGRAKLARAPQLAQPRIVAAIAALPAGERRRIASALRALVEAIGADATSPRMLFEDERPRAAGRRRTGRAKPRG